MKKFFGVVVSVIAILILAILTYFFIIGITPELDDEINMFYWGNETDPPVIAQNFERDFGVKVNVYDFESESSMVEVLKSGNTDYDVIGVSDIYINELINAGLIVPMDIRYVPNLNNLAEPCTDFTYNSEGYYMAPSIWVTNGLVINTKYVPEDTSSWGVLWNSEYSGRIALQDNRNDVIQAALKYIGHPVFAENIFQLLEAKPFLIQQKSIISGYKNQFVLVDELVSEEIWVSHISSAMANIALSRNSDLKYIIPEEGSAFVPIGFAIPSTSRKKYTAEVFINYLLRADNNADMASYDFVAPCIEGADEFLNEEFKNNPAIYPGPDTINRLESPANYNVTDQILNEIESIWQELIEGELS